MYFQQATFLLDGVPDPRALGAAWQRVVDRTPVLRSCVVWEGVAEPLQLVPRRRPDAVIQRSVRTATDAAVARNPWRRPLHADTVGWMPGRCNSSSRRVRVHAG